MISILNWFDKVFNFSIHINLFKLTSESKFIRNIIFSSIERKTYYLYATRIFLLWSSVSNMILMFFLSFFLLRFVRRTSHRRLLNSIFSLNFSGMIRNDNTSRNFFLRFFNFFFGHSFSVPKKSFLKWYILKHSNFLGW